jgi:hypothetical protein
LIAAITFKIGLDPAVYRLTPVDSGVGSD